MNHGRLNYLSALWCRAYRFWRTELAEDQCDAYALACMAHEPLDVEAAMDQFNAALPPNGQKPRPPMPADILQLLSPVADTEADANAIASAIWAAIGSCGYCNPKRAREKLGDDGWAVAMMLDKDWASLCASANVEARGSFFAQARDVAECHLQRRAQADLASARLAILASKQGSVRRLAEPVAQRRPMPAGMQGVGHILADMGGAVGMP